jgi:ribosome biogenesis GTPase / thiamine phosphate phosphatase
VGGDARVSPRAIGEDDFDSYDRPRRHTRPRTKDRPSYPDAVPGFVVTVDRGRFTVRVGAGAAARNVFAVKARPLGRKGVVVGDRVRLVGDDSGDDGALARIIEVLDRSTVLRRSSDDSDPVERILVANAAQLVIVASIADPPPRPRLIDRCLVAAYAAGMTPLLCLTKGDLGDPSELLSIYRALGVSSVVTQRGSSLEPLLERLRHQVSVLVGHSGVGKSTLVNALVPGAARTTGIVNAVTGRGRHTSTSAYALELSGGGWVIDTPGIRSFGLAHVNPRDLIGAFDDLDRITDDCPRGCTHAASEPECGLDVAVAEGRVDPDRVESFRRLLASRESAGVDG